MLALVFLAAQVEGYGEESVGVSPIGFHVIEVVQDHATQLIRVVLNVSGGPDVVPLPYFSKKNWAAEAPQQFDKTNHPCYGTSDVCCLNRFLADYQVDEASIAWANNSQICPVHTSNVTSPSQSSPLLSSMVFPGFLVDSTVIAHVDGVDGYGGVSSTSVGSGNNYQLILTMPIDYLQVDLFEDTGSGARGRVTETEILGTFKYEFFVGVVFVVLKQSGPDVLIRVMQENIQFEKSDFMLDKPYTLNSTLYTLYPKLYTLHPIPSPLHSEPYVLNPMP